MSGDSALARVAIGGLPLLWPLTGVGRYTLQLAREMQALLPEPPWLFYDRTWSREIRTPPTPTRASDAITAAKRVVPGGARISRMLQRQRFKRGVRAHGIELYHEPNFLAFPFDGPTVVTVHDLSWIRYPEAHPGERVRTMNREMPGAVARATRILTDSEFVRGEVISHFGVPAERVTAIPLGVEPRFRPFAPEAGRATLDRHGLRFGEYVLVVGTLEPRKNVATALAAYERLPEALRKRFPLAVAGMEGWGDHKIEAHRLGYVPDDDLPALYSGARAFVYPSIYEGFGLPPLEAMACGAPVIVSDRTSLPEVVGGAGMRVDPQDDAGLATRLQALLEDDALRARHAEAGIAQAKRFTWAACAAATLAEYRRALERLR
jgi:alpha-1,3-rhamnosyl/mannosyltransferase